MSRRRTYVETRSKRSFNITLFTGLFLVVGGFFIVTEIFGQGIFPFDWGFVKIYIAVGISGFLLAWVVKKIEKIEENW